MSPIYIPILNSCENVLLTQTVEEMPASQEGRKEKHPLPSSSSRNTPPPAPTLRFFSPFIGVWIPQGSYICIYIYIPREVK